MRLGVIVSKFNKDITRSMLEAAKEEAKEQGLEVTKVLEVPGAYDIPYAAQKLLKEDNIDCIATLGAVIKGDTDHDRLITDVMAGRLTDLSLRYDKPVSLGVIGPGVTWKQAEDRAQEYAQRAVQTAKRLLEL